MDANQSREPASPTGTVPAWASEAFDQFRARYDRKRCKALAVANWKEALRLLWYRGADDREPNGGILRSIRNHPGALGYEWLDRYPLKAPRGDVESQAETRIERNASPSPAAVTFTFDVGDVVCWTNDYGVKFHGRRIVELDSNTESGPRYYLEPTDAPWMYVREERLVLETMSPDQLGALLSHDGCLRRHCARRPEYLAEIVAGIASQQSDRANAIAPVA